MTHMCVRLEIRIFRRGRVGARSASEIHGLAGLTMDKLKAIELYYHAHMARRVQDLRCSLREANERTTSWIKLEGFT